MVDGYRSGFLSGAESFGGSAMEPVGALRPNAFGLHDVAGNVSEWCRDRFPRYEFPRTLPGSGSGSGSSHRNAHVARRLARLARARSAILSPEVGLALGAPPTGVRPARRLFR